MTRLCFCFGSQAVVYYANNEKLLCEEQTKRQIWSQHPAERGVEVSGFAWMVPGSPPSLEQDLPEKLK